MDGFSAYKYYMATKLHFTTDKYDVFESNGHVKGTRDVFNARNDRYIFEKLARKFDKAFDLIQFYVANFAYGNDAVIYCNDDAAQNLITWQKRKQSLTETFRNDVHKIVLHLEKNKLAPSDLFRFEQNDFPELLKLYLGGHVCIETMVILDEYEAYLADWKRNANLLWEEEYRRIVKSKRFVKFDAEKLRLIHQELYG